MCGLDNFTCVSFYCVSYHFEFFRGESFRLIGVVTTEIYYQTDIKTNALSKAAILPLCRIGLSKNRYSSQILCRMGSSNNNKHSMILQKCNKIRNSFQNYLLQFDISIHVKLCCVM